MKVMRVLKGGEEEGEEGDWGSDEDGEEEEWEGKEKGGANEYEYYDGDDWEGEDEGEEDNEEEEDDEGYGEGKKSQMHDDDVLCSSSGSLMGRS